MSRGIKKWLMLQMWRVQQIAQILTLVMLAITDAILVFDYTDGLQVSGEPLFQSRALGVMFLLLIIGALVWAAAFMWDMRLKMWREQMTVLAEKNPFAKEKMTPKEITIYMTLWLPLMERLAKDDPKIKASADSLRRWLLRSMKEDGVTEREVNIILEYIGGSENNLLGQEE